MTERSAGALETPSGKGSGDENFPVGSWLLPARLRPHVATFYAFVRAADDVADNPALAPEEKVRRLGRLEAGLKGADPDDPALAKAHRLRRSLAATGVTDRHARDLLAAFRQDATKLRYPDWADLMAYCAKSAAPVGRFLLDLHGEDPADYAGSDPLCHALQVINHLQDCGDDYRDLDRVYLPLDWLAAEGVGVAVLGRPAAGAGLRRVLDRALAETEALLDRSRPLARRLRSRRLAMETAVIQRLAERLCRELRRRDPLATRVVLAKTDILVAGLGGVAAPWRPGRAAA